MGGEGARVGSLGGTLVPTWPSTRKQLAAPGPFRTFLHSIWGVWRRVVSGVSTGANLVLPTFETTSWVSPPSFFSNFGVLLGLLGSNFSSTCNITVRTTNIQYRST